MAAEVGSCVSCIACKWTTLGFCSLCNNTEELLNFLVRHHVVLGCCWCERCGELCRVDFARLSFRCDRRHVQRDSRGRRRMWRCNYSRSLFLGTWFSSVRLPLQTVCKLICLWLTFRFPRQNLIKTELRISSSTVVNWSSFCREVCIYWLEKSSQVLGGPGVVVEVDEAKFGKRRFNACTWFRAWFKKLLLGSSA